MLLRAWREGDAQAFGELVRKYMRRAYFTAVGLVGNHEDAMDLSQEAFVRAFQARERFDIRNKFFTWYYRILRNLCLNHLRQRSRFTEVGTEIGQAGPSHLESPLGADLADPAILAERNELIQHLWEALGRLKPEDREILVLREIEDCSYTEISERLEVPLGTVMSRLFHARKRLKETMGQCL